MNVSLVRSLFTRNVSNARENGLEPVSAADINAFLSSVDTALAHNSESNIQICQDFICKHMTLSLTRVNILGGLFVGLSKFTEVERPDDGEPVILMAGVRQRITFALIVSAVLRQLHPATQHAPGPEQAVGTQTRPDGDSDDSIAKLKELFEALVELVAQSAANEDGTHTVTFNQLIAILGQLSKAQALTHHELKRLIRTIGLAAQRARGEIPPKPVVAKEDWRFENFGPNVWDLPASVLVDHLIKNPDRPMDTYPAKLPDIQFGEPSRKIQHALDDFWDEVDMRVGPPSPQNGPNPEPNIVKDEEYHEAWANKDAMFFGLSNANPEVTPRNHFGWSLDLCADMNETGIPRSVVAQRKALEEEHESRLREQPSRGRLRSLSPSRSGYDGGRYDERDYHGSSSRSSGRPISRDSEDSGGHQDLYDQENHFGRRSSRADKQSDDLPDNRFDKSSGNRFDDHSDDRDRRYDNHSDTRFENRSEYRAEALQESRFDNHSEPRYDNRSDNRSGAHQGNRFDYYSDHRFDDSGRGDRDQRGGRSYDDHSGGHQGGGGHHGGGAHYGGGGHHGGHHNGGGRSGGHSGTEWNARGNGRGGNNSFHNGPFNNGNFTNHSNHNFGNNGTGTGNNTYNNGGYSNNDGGYGANNHAFYGGVAHGNPSFSFTGIGNGPGYHGPGANAVPSGHAGQYQYQHGRGHGPGHGNRGGGRGGRGGGGRNRG